MPMKTLQRLVLNLYLIGVVLLPALTFPVKGQGTNVPAVTAQTSGPATVAVTPVTSRKENLSFGLDRVPQLDREVMGIPLWQYLATLIYVVLAFLAAKLFDYLVTVQLRKITARTKA